MDYREKQNRREAFVRWYAWSLKYKDCDPAVWQTNYLNNRYEHNSEEKMWLSWLYGNTYHLPTAWVIKNEFPDFELVTSSRITAWNEKNYKRLRYQTDTKWNKGHLPAMFESYKNYIGKNNQKQKFESLYGDNEFQNFENIWNSVKSNLHKFGRYGTWFYLQHLKHTCNIIIEPKSLMLDDYSGSRSHRNGLVHAFGEDDWVDEKLSETEINKLNDFAESILMEMKERFPEVISEIDYFTMETCLCSFKKLFRSHHGRYLGYYLDRQAEEILVAENDGWDGIEWDVLWQSRNETLDPRLSPCRMVNKGNFTYFMERGKIEKLSWIFKDEKEILEGLEKFG